MRSIESVPHPGLVAMPGPYSLLSRIIMDLITVLASAYRHASAAVPSTGELTEFSRWIDREFAQIPCHVAFTTGEVSPEFMISTYQATGALLISTANSEHPFITAEQNARFRAVHDWHHLKHDCDFTFSGERKAFKVAAASAPMSIRWMLASEILLQAAACIYFEAFQPQKFVRFSTF